MKVLLNENIEHLGRLGDVVEVKPGFARNYLFPRNLALQPNKHNLEVMKFKKIKAQKKLELEKLSAIEQKKKLEELTLTIPKKAGESDTLFGSVTTMEIQQMLENLGITIDRKKIHLDDHIKRLGSHSCRIKLVEEIEAIVKLEVVRQDGDEIQKEEITGKSAPVEAEKTETKTEA